MYCSVMRATRQPVSTPFIHSNNTPQYNTLEELQYPHLHSYPLLPEKAHPCWRCRSGYFRIDPQPAGHLPIADTAQNSIMLPSDVTAPCVSTSIQTRHTRKLFQ
jgi:hypothetical protein